MAGIFKCLVHKADLSVYAQEDEILYVCEQRHWWIVKASDTGTTDVAAAKRALSKVDLNRVTAADKSMLSLQERFGDDVLDAMIIE